MPTPMSLTEPFPAAPEAVLTLLRDEAFLTERMTATGGLNPEVVSIESDDADVTTITTRQAIPASALPSMVASMIPGDPTTERVETWRTDGDGFVADFSVTVKGAPASLKGTMRLTPGTDGSTLAVEGTATVPIPMFGAKIEETIVEQVSGFMIKEAEFTRTRLA